MQQRGKTKEGVKMLIRYGRKQPKSRYLLHSKDAEQEIARRQVWLQRLQKRQPNNRTMHKKLKKRIDAIETMRNCVAVFDNGKVVTVYNQTRRPRHQ
jgi:5'-3' exonuclease